MKVDSASGLRQQAVWIAAHAGTQSSLQDVSPRVVRYASRKANAYRGVSVKEAEAVQLVKHSEQFVIALGTALPR
jgi:hypothetical protein